MIWRWSFYVCCDKDRKEMWLLTLTLKWAGLSSQYSCKPFNLVSIFQVLQARTVSTISMTVRVITVRMVACVWMESTPTTASVNQNLQVPTTFLSSPQIVLCRWNVVDLETIHSFFWGINNSCLFHHRSALPGWCWWVPAYAQCMSEWRHLPQHLRRLPVCVRERLVWRRLQREYRRLRQCCLLSGIYLPWPRGFVLLRMSSWSYRCVWKIKPKS